MSIDVKYATKSQTVLAGYKSDKQISKTLVGNGAIALILAVCSFAGGTANALPGKTSEEVADWIRTNPALRPSSSERLLVKKSDTPARRFQFQASILPPGRAIFKPGNVNLIRSEQILFFDIINGVTRDRLEESLRSIYGPSIMRDFAAAKTVYAYPTQEMIARASRTSGSVLSIALQGEIREGQQFAYWLETVENASGKANSGQITVFELESIPKLEAELRQRELTAP